MEIGKILSEIKKGTIIGLLLISFYGIGVYVYKNKNKVETKIQIKNRKNNETSKENAEKDIDTQNLQNENNKIINGYRHKNGYVYKWSENEKSAFVKRSLGYEKRFSKTTSQKELDNGLKEEYCNAVKEIKKVDRKIVPGTNIPFEEATHTQVDDAYKEYLQEIAQIRQIYFIQQLNNNTNFEQRIGCQYKDTKWNMDNYRYSPSIFDSSKIYDYFE